MSDHADVAPPVYAIRIGTDKDGHIFFSIADVCRALDIFREADGHYRTERAILFVDPSDRLIPTAQAGQLEAGFVSDKVDHIYITEPGVARLAKTASGERAEALTCWIESGLVPLIVNGP